jgi:hypothetical protein
MTDWDVFEHAGYHYRDDVFGGNRRYANYAFMLSARDLQRVGGALPPSGTPAGRHPADLLVVDRKERPTRCHHSACRAPRTRRCGVRAERHRHGTVDHRLQRVLAPRCPGTGLTLTQRCELGDFVVIRMRRAWRRTFSERGATPVEQRMGGSEFSRTWARRRRHEMETCRRGGRRRWLERLLEDSRRPYGTPGNGLIAAAFAVWRRSVHRVQFSLPRMGTSSYFTSTVLARRAIE